MATIGKYINTSVSWLSTPILKKSTLKKERKKKIVNPIFLKAQKYTEDVFWQGLLKKAALGKFPRKINLQGDFLCLIGAKDNKVAIPSDPSKAANVFINFLQKTKGLLSETDKANDLEEQKNFELEKCIVSWDNWKNIPGKQKSFLLEQYVLNLSEDMNLNPEQVSQLRKIIAIGKTLKCFNISLGHGFIESIDGLIFDEDSSSFNISEERIKKRIKSKNKKNRTTTYRRPTITIETSL